MALTRITSAGISDGVIDVADISDNTITGAKLASDIAITTSGTIAANTVTASNSTIAGSNLSNAAFLAGDTSTGLGIDSNEVVSKGNNLLLGVIDAGGAVEFREANTERLRFELDSTPTIRSATDLGLIVNSSTNAIQITSSGNVGIGTSSPDNKLHIQNGDASASSNAYSNLTIESSSSINALQFLSPNTAQQQIRFGDPQDDGNGYIAYNHSGVHLSFGVNGPEKMRINSDGQILINDTSATTVGAKFEVNGSSYFRKDHTSGVPSGNISNLNYNHALVLANRNGSSDTNISSLGFDVTTSSAVSNGAITFESTASGTGDFAFYLETGNTIYERMRITSAGHVLIGQTSPSTTDDGHYFQSTGTAIHVANSNRSLDLYRLSDNGDTLQMYQGSTICGRIGVYGGNAIYINAPSNGGAGLIFSNNAAPIYPAERASGTVGLVDNYVDLGAAVWRFDDIYATNGTIQTSDQNEKQSIQLLTDSEISVAKRISKGFKTFKWNSAVEEKGDNARTHTGVIAQEVQQAFTDEGLDVTKYAFFMSNTYWEKERVIPAVEEITDEEGNITQEAQPEHTVIDKWEVESEAEEGAVQKTRLGIRYPELLSFVSSAFEQRLTNIETRLDALENA